MLEDTFGRAPVIPETRLSAVIRLFPWNNGITLLQGSMADTLRTFWEGNGVEDTGIESSLLLVRLTFMLILCDSHR
jgi:hypothetical protein